MSFAEKESIKTQSFFKKIKNPKIIHKFEEKTIFFTKTKSYTIETYKQKILVKRKNRKIFSFNFNKISEWFWEIDQTNQFICFYGNYLDSDIVNLYLLDLNKKKVVKKWQVAFGSIMFDGKHLLISGRKYFDFNKKYLPANIIEYNLESKIEKEIYKSEAGVITYLSKINNKIYAMEIKTQITRFIPIRPNSSKIDKNLLKWKNRELINCNKQSWLLDQDKKQTIHYLQEINQKNDSLGRKIKFKNWITINNYSSSSIEAIVLLQMNKIGQTRIIIIQNGKIIKNISLGIGIELFEDETFFHKNKFFFQYLDKNFKISKHFDLKKNKTFEKKENKYPELKDLNVSLKKDKRNWIFIYKLKQTKSHNCPTIISTYGGFNQTSFPSYENYYDFLKKGGILCEVWPRGQIHESFYNKINSSRKNKHKTFNDVIESTEFLIKNKISNPKKIGIIGASNGGLVVASVINKRPDLFSAAVVEVGVLDMMNYFQFTGGDVWSCEYGSNLKHLKSISPLHNVKKNKKYPPVYVISGKNDSRVAKFHQISYANKLKENKHFVLFQQFNAAHSIRSIRLDKNVLKFFNKYLIE